MLNTDISRAGRGELAVAIAGLSTLDSAALGGLAASTRRRLGATVEEHVKQAPARRTLTAGTTLLRDWHGEHHQVTVLEGGVLYREPHYHSLSEVARQITGCRWSGPRFFGLPQARPE
jgi:hypothetical protein